MPFITNGNINAPVIMIGEKGADLVKRYWLSPTIRKKRRGRRDLNIKYQAGLNSTSESSR